MCYDGGLAKKVDSDLFDIFQHAHMTAGSFMDWFCFENTKLKILSYLLKLLTYLCKKLNCGEGAVVDIWLKKTVIRR